MEGLAAVDPLNPNELVAGAVPPKLNPVLLAAGVAFVPPKLNPLAGAGVAAVPVPLKPGVLLVAAVPVLPKLKPEEDALGAVADVPPNENQLEGTEVVAVVAAAGPFKLKPLEPAAGVAAPPKLNPPEVDAGVGAVPKVKPLEAAAGVPPPKLKVLAAGCAVVPNIMDPGMRGLFSKRYQSNKAVWCKRS